MFRHTENRKWFGVVMDVEREKLGLPGTGTVFLLDVKTGPIRQRRIRKYFLVGMVQPILGAALFFLWCFAML